MANIFERSEVKYMLTKEQYLALIDEVGINMVKDKFFNYKICNIYYDTDNYELFRLSIDKPVFKEKLRLRSYGTPSNDDMVFLEIKKKFDGIVYKRRIDLPLKDAYKFIKDDDYMFDDSINAKELKYILQRYPLSPKVYLSYEREAWSWGDDENFRITFDTNIKYRLNNTNLENGDEGERLFDDDMVLMELKCLNNLPIEFVKALTKLKAYPISFSKIGTVYTTKILNKERERIHT